MITTVTIKTSDGTRNAPAEKCTPNLAIVPEVGTLVDSEEQAFTGEWNLTHIPTGYKLGPAFWTSGGFGSIRDFARWLESAADLSFTDPDGKAESFTPPVVAELKRFYTSPRAWTRPAEDETDGAA